ncbi:hypothetical protein SAMN05443575_2119 [Jatrophihabitans endophyticus]|uniref:YbaB/EbfC DNA-binding family protein n=1 Tax=Jatrophihabitans endophyticus TaxID=1206085 RepID=A0A1M5KDH4_9ACTN|nr:hypothetical protein [Jatrophihabitans endophyticus]SHG50690.1 hypothetical protein SAMN05443575_2119 [Jatrophihabitans endophyticus]
MTGATGGLGGADAVERFQRTIDGLEQELSDSTRRMERARDIGSIVADVVGAAQTEDGHVRVEFTAQGVHDLVLDPRAMRLGSADLAAAIKATIADAAADYQQRTLDAMREAGLVPSAEEQQRRLDEAVAQLGDAQRQFTTSLRSAAEVMGRAAQARPPRP